MVCLVCIYSRWLDQNNNSKRKPSARLMEDINPVRARPPTQLSSLVEKLELIHSVTQDGIHLEWVTIGEGKTSRQSLTPREWFIRPRQKRSGGMADSSQQNLKNPWSSKVFQHWRRHLQMTFECSPVQRTMLLSDLGQNRS